MLAGPILVTGSRGFVARHLLARLAENGCGARDVVCVSRRSPAPDGGHALDLADAEATDALIRTVRPATVFHLAAQSSPARARLAPSQVWRSNRDATYRLARAIARHAPQATVLFASTGEVYGLSLAAGPADESTPPRPAGPYAASKRAAEAVLETFLPETARLVVARPFNHTGPGQDEAFVVASFAAQLARIEAGLAPPCIEVGNLSPERDFLDVRDVVDCYVRLAEGGCGLPHRLVVNIARGTPVPVGEVLRTLIGLARCEVSVRVDPERWRPADVPVATADTARLSRILAWPPARPLADTLSDVLEDKRAAVAAERSGGGPGSS